MVYLYALAADVGELSDLHGIKGEPLTTIPVSHAVTIAGEFEMLPEVTPQTLKAQDALVRALHVRSAALLPMRFGTAAIDATDARRLVTARRDLLDRLAHVRGCEQMVVRVLGPAAVERAVAHVDAPSGTEYLRARAQLQQSPPALAAIARAAGPLARDVRVDPARQPGLVGSVYHLIGRGSADEYRVLIERAAADVSGIHVFITGPAPAYAFA